MASPLKLFFLLVRNVLRSRTRLITTLLGCAIGAFIATFFLAADYSLKRMTDVTGRNANLVVRQKDRY